MKTRRQIKKKLRTAKFHYLKREYLAQVARLPCNCIHNTRYTPRVYAIDDDGDLVLRDSAEVGLCLYGAENAETWPGNLCDDPETAQECPLFQLPETEPDIKTLLKSDLALRFEDPQIVANEYKDVAALQWILGPEKTAWSLTRVQNVIFSLTVIFTKVGLYLLKAKDKVWP